MSRMLYSGGKSVSQPLEHRIARPEASVEHLNGAYEQIDKRLGDLRSDTVAGFVRVDQHFDSLEAKLESKYDKLDSKMDASVRMLVTWMIGNTGIILGAIATVAFLRH